MKNFLMLAVLALVSPLVATAEEAATTEEAEMAAVETETTADGAMTETTAVIEEEKGEAEAAPAE